MTAAIGVMHGYGFLFGLSTILGNDAANLWVSLAAFNVGVEIGQLAIVLVVWTIYVVALRIVKHRQTYVRGVVAVPHSATRRAASLYASGMRCIMRATGTKG